MESHKFLSLSTMYAGYIESLYQRMPEIRKMSYTDHLALLFSDSTDFTGSYVKNFRKLGFEASAIIANDLSLQKKWSSENPASKGKNILFEQVSMYNPDILWIDNLSLVDEQWIAEIRERNRNIKIVIGYHCSPVNPRVLNSVKAVDIMITCTPGLQAFFESYGKRTFLVYHAFDSDATAFIDEKISQVHDLIFSGSLTTGDSFHGDRLNLIEKIVESGIDIELYVNLESRSRILTKQGIYALNNILKSAGLGSLTSKTRLLQLGRSGVKNYSDSLLKKTKSPVYGSEMYNLLHNSRITLNYHIGIAGDYAGNMRMFEATGVGSCLLTDKKKNVGDLFIPGTEIVVYENYNDCIEKIKWLLGNEEARQKIAEAGRKRTLEEHTTEIRCKIIKDIITAELGKSR